VEEVLMFPVHTQDPAPLPTQQPRTILVVDDESAIREMLSTILTMDGYTVAMAHSGHDALYYLYTHPRPCCILLDVQMAHGDAHAFRAFQQRDTDAARIPVVLMSARAELADTAAALALPYLAKPFTWDQLMEVLRRYCA
jgi:two-component system phosphate regulon response regulator PhoB